ncbi:MAG TPA: tRNA pseudouridine(55) synthase TruB [Candidatus Saccharimonadales bacterium]|nr:tRNA pseudouridine(55) synthase TruB [Candidatus Saccharimonadales bacterium]
MNGILLVDKPSGWTSFDVVGKVRSLITKSPHNTTHKKRYPVGHTGTLDPLATGLLVLLIGTYTKRAVQLTKLDKTYEVVMKLGETSTTGDEEGAKTLVSDRVPTQQEVNNALAQFVGEIMQTPPAFSAIKINGQRAYDLARKGQAPELQPRPVRVRDLRLTKYAYPLVYFTAEVSSGTYVRSLAEDIGAVLQTGAYMSQLRRTRVGTYDIADANLMDGLTADHIAAHLKQA